MAVAKTCERYNAEPHARRLYQNTKELLARRVGFRCSNPGCRKPTSGTQGDPRGSVNIGVASHIAAASPGGTGYDPSMAAEVRPSIDNGIWLCQNCAKLIDNDALAYSVDILKAWRALAEATSKSEIERGITVQVDERFLRAGRDMPQLVAEMRADLKESPRRAAASRCMPSSTTTYRR